MSEKVRIGGIILLIKLFFILPVLHYHGVAWFGQVACVSVSLTLMVLAFLCIRPRTSDFVIILGGQAVQFLSAGAWFLIGERLRASMEAWGVVYHQTLDFTWDHEAFFYIFLGGILQTTFLYFYRNAVRYDKGWRD